jgi:hypothetical protein
MLTRRLRRANFLRDLGSCRSLNHRGIALKNAKKVSSILLAALVASTLAVTTHGSAAYADETAPPATDTPAVVGLDSDGNPIYQTSTAVEFADPEETLPAETPFPEQKETTVVMAPPADQQTCTARTTVTVKNIPNSLSVDYADSVINRKTVKAKFTVKAEISKAFKWSVAASVTGEFQALIFSKVSATINAGVEKTKTTTYGSTIEVEVAPKDTTFVDRGMWQEKFSYTYSRLQKNCLKTSGSGKGQAPYRQAWHIY